MESKQQENERDFVIACVDCGTGFVLTPGERQFYIDRGLHLPKRCPVCRKLRRQGGSRA